jgi:hypothetical protein
MIRSLAILAASLFACSAGQAQRTTEEVHLHATVQDIVLLSHFSGKITPVNFDPRFALTVRVESVIPATTNFTPGAVVAFAIHSPSMLFDGEAAIGKTYDFSLMREVEHGKTRFFGLRVEKAQTAPARAVPIHWAITEPVNVGFPLSI